MHNPYRIYSKAAQLGVIAGMRSLMAPALLSRHYVANPPAHQMGTALTFVQSPRTAGVLTLLAGGELIGDKLPDTPNRTDAPGLIGRVGSGAFCGAAMAQAEGQQTGLGALAGGLGALAGTYAFFQLRRWLTHDRGLPNALVALAEDALSIGGGMWLLKRI